MNGSWLTRPQENGVDTYVDLTKNPERWTGYGPQQYSSDIWRAIYDENCFESSGSNEGNDMCEEETTFKKIISGFHASVSTHIASEFCEEVDPDSSHCLRFSSSADEFQRRVGAHPDRVDNLYFLYLFMLRAFSKASDALSAVDFDAGDVVEASRIRKSVVDLSRQIELATDAKSDLCYRMMSGRPFDETIFFSGTRASMRDDFRGTFRNISSIMNCVGCDKCKLWGKLQLEGISVAMKVLLDDADLSTLDLTRTEVVAFVNALHVFSKSVEIVSDFQNRAKLSERDFVSSSSSSDQIEEHEEAEEEEEEQSQGGPQAPSTALLLLLGTAAFFLFSRRPPSVEWRDLDPMNHVNNCAFFAFFENARIQVFQDQLGLDMSLKPSGLAPVISHTECRYLKQVRLPDELEIRTSVEGVEPERAQYKHKYECFSTSQQEVVAIGSATIVMLNFDGKSASRAPLSDDFVRKLTS
eukprot:g1432.t1